jgi:hypothetical protein
VKLKTLYLILLGICVFSVTAASGLAGMKSADQAKLVGAWGLEIDAEGEYYYLAIVIEESDGILSGKISEESGFFTDVVIEQIKFDGKTLAFQFDAPTPPDGEERTLDAELVFSGDTCEGTISIEDLGMILDMSGKKVK